VLGAAALHAWSSERRAGPTVFQWSARFPLLAVDVERGRLDGAREHARAMLDERRQPLPAEVQVALRAALERGTRAAFGGAVAAGRAGGYTQSANGWSCVAGVVRARTVVYRPKRSSRTGGTRCVVVGSSPPWRERQSSSSFQ
jgi:hypothetical protein